MSRSFQNLPSIFLTLGFIVWFLLEPSYEPILTLAAILLHEVGHTVAAMALKVPLGGFRLLPSEARISISGTLLSYGKEICISAAGPLVNILSAVGACLYGGSILGEGGLSFFATVSVAIAALNLLPVADLDGGRIFCCLLSRLLGPRVADPICKLLSFLALFCLWCISVYALIRTGTTLSLFLFSATLFMRIFSHA